MHAEQRIKVNAWIDAGIAPVVEALNRFEEVETLSSCEGDGHTFFHVRGDGDALYRFVNWLTAELAAEMNACCEFRLSMEWPGSHTTYGALHVAPGTAGPVSKALLAVSRRRTPSGGGNSGTEVRS